MKPTTSRRLAAVSKVFGAVLGMVAVAAAIALVAAGALSHADQPRAAPDPDAAPPAATGAAEAPLGQGSDLGEREAREPRPIRERIEWRRSRALGAPNDGRLVRGVRLPAQGPTFFSWDPIEKTKPNRDWRRYGTDELVRTLLRVARGFARDNPGAPRIAIGDLSRPEGGDFGPQWGSIGHASHQNGLDADIYYPLRSGRERAPRSVDEIDMRLAQDLVDRFVAAGAEHVFVGPSTPLTGPPGVVQKLVHHDNHLHVRIRPSGG